MDSHYRLRTQQWPELYREIANRERLLDKTHGVAELEKPGRLLVVRAAHQPDRHRRHFCPDGAEGRVAVGTVIGFPHGSNATEVKRYETAMACRDGATEIDMVINVGKALGGDFAFVEGDIRAVVEEAHRHGALVKVILETDFLADDKIKIRLCEICGTTGADFVKTSTGFGFVKQANGGYNYQGATAHDLALMRAHSPATVQVKASGGIRNLDDLILARDLGATRCGTSATAALMDEYRRRESAGSLEIPAGTQNPSQEGY